LSFQLLLQGSTPGLLVQNDDVRLLAGSEQIINEPLQRCMLCPVDPFL